MVFFFILQVFSFLIVYRYPKAGTPNPIAALKVADLADPKNFRIREIKPPELFVDK